ncbi:hypothetical protein JTE90_004194 [Oedothorax gibbosus]|uniref:Uncharacterized protein n=1 Tax=Oedothorax gibbosus TaxID=931172 RepID=A0AAV6UQ37_9ARAC|nr:hypothetical protein JTE90_004194 [Oedothorax gibbosus]
MNLSVCNPGPNAEETPDSCRRGLKPSGTISPRTTTTQLPCLRLFFYSFLLDTKNSRRLDIKVGAKKLFFVYLGIE